MEQYCKETGMMGKNYVIIKVNRLSSSSSICILFNDAIVQEKISYN